jgi:hypothetical protein
MPHEEEQRRLHHFRIQKPQQNYFHSRLWSLYTGAVTGRAVQEGRCPLISFE